MSSLCRGSTNNSETWNKALVIPHLSLVKNLISLLAILAGAVVQSPFWVLSRIFRIIVLPRNVRGTAP